MQAISRRSWLISDVEVSFVSPFLSCAISGVGKTISRSIISSHLLSRESIWHVLTTLARPSYVMLVQILQNPYVRSITKPVKVLSSA